MEKYIKPIVTGIILAVGFALVWVFLVRPGKLTVENWERIKKRISKNAKKQTMAEIIDDLNSILS